MKKPSIVAYRKLLTLRCLWLFTCVRECVVFDEEGSLSTGSILISHYTGELHLSPCHNVLCYHEQVSVLHFPTWAYTSFLPPPHLLRILLGQLLSHLSLVEQCLNTMMPPDSIVIQMPIINTFLRII